MVVAKTKRNLHSWNWITFDTYKIIGPQHCSKCGITRMLHGNNRYKYLWRDGEWRNSNPGCRPMSQEKHANYQDG